MTPSELKAYYQDCKIEKHDFIDRMHQFHKILFDYVHALAGTDVTKIEIDADGVYFTVKPKCLPDAGEGLRFWIDPSDHRIAPIEALNFNSYEDNDLAMISRLLKPGQTILDIGANIGFYSLSLAKQFPDSQFLAFEPIPKTFAQLQKNVGMNRLQNVQTHNFGFSDEKKILSFFFYPEGSGNASSARLSNRDSVEEIPCSVMTVDEFVETNKLRVDFIKCDVEGAELLVFRGANSVLDTQRPIVFSEILRKWSKKFNYSPNDIFQLFRSKNYSSYTCANGELVPFPEMTESSLETNFFFIPNV